MQAAEKIPNNASTSLSEYYAITRTVQTYINGGKSGRGADMKPAFQAPCVRSGKAVQKGFCKLAGIKDLRIQDLRHSATTVLFMDEIPDAMIAKMTGHRSRELRKYQHLSPEFKRQTVEKIAQKLTGTVACF